MFVQSARTSAILALTALLALPSALPAQTDGEQPPSAGQPPDFSQVVGTYRISSFSAQPTEVVVEDPITVTVHITGKGPQKYQPRRGPLRLFEESVQHDFYVEPVPDQDQVIPEKNGESTWVFVYRLRPKTTKVQEIPEPRLRYYMPRGGYKFARRPPEEDPIPLTVKPRREIQPDDLGLKNVQAPERFYQLAGGEAMLARDDPVPYWNADLLIGVGLGAPAASWLGLVLWQWLFPGGIRRLQRRRSLAARRAVRELGAAQGTYSVAVLSKILAGYLSQRLDFPAVEPTPLEVARFLRRRGVAADVRQQWTQLFCNFDEARYTPPSSGRAPMNGDSWPAKAVNLIHALEADPCLTSAR